jgi:hypothetical protein
MSLLQSKVHCLEGAEAEVKRLKVQLAESGKLLGVTRKAGVEAVFNNSAVLKAKIKNNIFVNVYKKFYLNLLHFKPAS